VFKKMCFARIALMVGVGLVCGGLVGGCEGSVLVTGEEQSLKTPQHQGAQSDNTLDPFAPCTDPAVCCPQYAVHCDGDPDEYIFCTCDEVWQCETEGGKQRCAIGLPQPSGVVEGSCSWSESAYQCKRSGNESAPAGFVGWTCGEPDEFRVQTCEASYPPNPTNAPDGTTVWTCSIDQDEQRLVCERARPAQTVPQITDGVNLNPSAGGTHSSTGPVSG